MKKILFIAFVISLMLAFSLCILAEEYDVEATTIEDITGTIELAQDGDTVNLILNGDLILEKGIQITKALTINLYFNGYQISYTDTPDKNTTTAAFSVGNAGAILNLWGSNPLDDPSEYTHYDNNVKADMVGTGNLVGISTGTVNIRDSYIYATNDTYVIFVGLTKGADISVLVDTSVLRVNDSKSMGAICFLGGNNSGNDGIVKKTLTLENSVEYGGFKGHDCAFNVTRGSSVTNVKFYDFAIRNDCWFGIGSLYMNSFADAMPFFHCIFNTYDEETGSVSVRTETGKQNIKLYDCEFTEIVNGGKFSGDSGGTAHVYIIEKMPSCIEDGVAYSYSNPKGAQNTADMSTYKKDSFKLAKSGHTDGEEIIVYKNGYAKNGAGVIECTVCFERYETGAIYEPLAEYLGYSLNQAGNSVTVGVRLNNEAINEFLEVTKPQSFEFGALAGSSSTIISLENGKVTVENGYYTTLDYTRCQYFDLKIMGFDEGNKDKEFMAEYYIYDGEGVSFVKDSAFDTEKNTFNGIVDLLDEVKRDARELLKSKHTLYYNEDGSFRVLVLADLHVSPSSNVTALQERIKTMVDTQRPNLVVFTGDNVVGAGNESTLRTCIDKMVSYIEEKEIPWCHVYGNHDREAGMSNEAQQAVYESYEYCISKDVEGISGVGNYVHGIFNKNGTLGSVMYFLDSGTKSSTYSYEYIQDDQIAWYKNTSEILEKYAGKRVDGIMAFHIPLLENQYAYDNRNNTDIVYSYSGDRGEAICPSTFDTNLFETVRERGDVKAIVTGHDHSNSYAYNYYGVLLCSAPTISKLGYSGGDAFDGCRVFNISNTEIKTHVSYVIERVNPDDYDAFEGGTVIADFEQGEEKLVCEGLDNGNLNGSFNASFEDGKLKLVRSASGNSEVNVYFDKDSYGKLGNNKYLVVWVDFTSVDFRKACFGLLSSSIAIPYRTDDYDQNTPLYYLADGETEWQVMSHGNDGCFGTAQNSSMDGKCGYIAVPVEYFRSGIGGASMNSDTLITGFYMYCDVSKGTNQAFYLDNIMLVEDYNTVK